MKPPREARWLGTVLAAALVSLILVGCSGPILANPPLVPSIPETPPPTAAAPADPQPLVFPRDDGPHHRLTEWWYYTGHLESEDGRSFGFEAVVFRAERGLAPVTWASHLALTDESGGRFMYGQRAVIGPSVDRGVADVNGDQTGFTLAVGGFDPSGAVREPWILSGSGGSDQIQAALAPEEATGGGPFALDLAVASRDPVVAHGGIGWIDFGSAGSSYYYSRPRMTASGSITLDGQVLRVRGTAWFDHQWGDFVSVGGGGWDWFAVNLDDGTDLTISLVRAPDGSYPLIYGTLVMDGVARGLERTELSVESDPTRTWTSPGTGSIYPARWTLTIPGAGLVIGLEPTVADQELDTRATTGVVYWEGSQQVSATRDGMPIGGKAYVELTGYGPPTP
ncbi:MAG: lipocalin-like domain-containing protein [Chloroflexota bacterium]